MWTFIVFTLLLASEHSYSQMPLGGEPPAFLKNDKLLERARENEDPKVREKIMNQIQSKGPEGLQDEKFRKELEALLNSKTEKNCTDCVPKTTSGSPQDQIHQSSGISKEDLKKMRASYEDEGPKQMTPEEWFKKEEKKERMQKRMLSRIKTMPCPSPDDDDEFDPSEMLSFGGTGEGRGMRGQEMLPDPELMEKIEVEIERKMRNCKREMKKQMQAQMAVGTFPGGGAMGAGMGQMNGMAYNQGYSSGMGSYGLPQASQNPGAYAGPYHYGYSAQPQFQNFSSGLGTWSNMR